MKFLACTDGSPYAEKAIKASAVAAKYAGYSLTLLHVLEDVVSYADFPDGPGFPDEAPSENMQISSRPPGLPAAVSFFDC